MIRCNFKNCCRVCGFDLKAPPWGESGDLPDFEICPCCSVQAGYGDTDVENCVEIRKYWITIENCKWGVERLKPPNWSLEEQLKCIPPGFRDEDLKKS